MWNYYKDKEVSFEFNRGWLSGALTVLVVALLVCTPVLCLPRERGEIKALEWLREHAQNGMSIAIENVHQYEVYLYLHSFEPEICGINTTPSADYILTTCIEANYSSLGYHLVELFYASGGFTESINVEADAALWARG